VVDKEVEYLDRAETYDVVDKVKGEKKVGIK
jgi:hypothetical protein